MKRWILGLYILCLSVSSFGEDLQLWLYYSTNLQVDENISKIEKVWKRAADAGYTHVMLADSKFSRLGGLGDMEKKYFANIGKVRKIAADNKLTIIPCLFPIGYSNSLLWHDPSLAEGLPVKEAPFIASKGKIIPTNDPNITLGKPDWKDDSVKIEGNMARIENPQGNSRMTYKLKVPRFRCYHVSVWIKTENFGGNPEIKALAGDKSLQYQNLGVEKTQDWKEYHVVFNTLENEQIAIYFGVWGGARGKLEWRDWKIEEAGLVNVLRRPGTPVEAKGFSEGKDFDRILDPKLGNDPWNGEYKAWHEPPSIKTSLPEGTKLSISYYHPAIIYDGQVSCCVSGQEISKLLEDEAERMKSAWNAKGYMMSHDEIRTLNWDKSCADRNLDAGKILADNVKFCAGLLNGSDVYVWNDMFDPFHNARKDYYLVRGNLSGSWEGLDKSVIIMNWNFSKRDDSLKFFADRGHRQVIAGYYDAPVKEVEKWLESSKKVKGVTGIMYTTWRNNYDNLEAFAEAVKK